MKLVILRGLPGTGKTTIAKKLAKKIKAKHIWVDGFKLKSSKKTWKEIVKDAHKKAIKELNKAKKTDTIILEEILYDRGFIKELKKFIKKGNHIARWIQIKRPLKELLKIELERKRKIKNTRKNFIDMQKGLDKSKVKGEVIIKNKNITKTISKISKISK